MEQVVEKIQEDLKKFQENEKVSHPSYYARWKELCGCEVIDITRHLPYNRGTAIAYIMRAGFKEEEGYTKLEKELEDLRKAAWHLNDEINLLQKKLYLKT